MTKLQQWLMLAMAFLAFWYALLTRMVPLFDDVPMVHIELLPVYSIAGFGLISAAIVLYRTFTFNNCNEASLELQAQIQEAKKFFKGKGLTVGNE